MATYCVKTSEWSETGQWGLRETTSVVANVEDYNEAIALAKSAVSYYVESQLKPEIMTCFELNNHHFGAYFDETYSDEAYGIRAWVEEEWIF